MKKIRLRSACRRKNDLIDRVAQPSGAVQGKRQQARELLGPIYQWFSEGFDKLDLNQPQVLLDELTQKSRRLGRLSSAC